MTDGTGPPSRLDPPFFERLFTDAGLAVFACDTEGRILAWNPLGERLVRTRCPDPGSPFVRDVLPEEHRPDLMERFRSVLATHEPTEFRTRIPDDDGHVVEYAAWLTAVYDDRGGVQCVCVWFHDITARLELRRRTRRRERLTTLGALAGSVAHHYSNLLCSIATSLEFAMNMNTMAAMRRVLGRTADAIARATRLTQQLLAFAQADHRVQDLADLTETVLCYFDEHEAELAARGVRLELSWGRIPFVPVPREQFTMVIDNLVRNAVEAMPRGGSLRVSLKRQNGEAVTCAIADTGSGIAPDEMERLFEPFFTTKGELGAGGTRQAGMGLAVAHGLISEMHGLISVSNVATGGARFEITLPLDPTR